MFHSEQNGIPFQGFEPALISAGSLWLLCEEQAFRIKSEEGQI